MRLIALHSISVMVSPGVLKDGPDARPVVAKFADHKTLKPGTIFDMEDSTAEEFIRLRSARKATSADEAIFAASGGKPVKVASSVDELTGDAARSAAPVGTDAGAPAGEVDAEAVATAEAEAADKAARVAGEAADKAASKASAAKRRAV